MAPSSASALSIPISEETDHRSEYKEHVIVVPKRFTSDLKMLKENQERALDIRLNHETGVNRQKSGFYQDSCIIGFALKNPPWPCVYAFLPSIKRQQLDDSRCVPISLLEKDSVLIEGVFLVINSLYSRLPQVNYEIGQNLRGKYGDFLKRFSNEHIHVDVPTHQDHQHASKPTTSATAPAPQSLAASGIPTRTKRKALAPPPILPHRDLPHGNHSSLNLQLAESTCTAIPYAPVESLSPQGMNTLPQSRHLYQEESIVPSPINTLRPQEWEVSRQRHICQNVDIAVYSEIAGTTINSTTQEIQEEALMPIPRFQHNLYNPGNYQQPVMKEEQDACTPYDSFTTKRQCTDYGLEATPTWAIAQSPGFLTNFYSPLAPMQTHSGYQYKDDAVTTEDFRPQSQVPANAGLDNEHYKEGRSTLVPPYGLPGNCSYAMNDLQSLPQVISNGREYGSPGGVMQTTPLAPFMFESQALKSSRTIADMRTASPKRRKVDIVPQETLRFPSKLEDKHGEPTDYLSYSAAHALQYNRDKAIEEFDMPCKFPDTTHILPLDRTASKHDLWERLHLDCPTHELLTKEANKARDSLNTNPQSLSGDFKANANLPQPYKWVNISEEAKRQGVLRMVSNASSITSQIYAKGSHKSSSGDDNWIARWYLHKSFRRRDTTRNRPALSANQRFYKEILREDRIMEFTNVLSEYYTKIPKAEVATMMSGGLEILEPDRILLYGSYNGRLEGCPDLLWWPQNVPYDGPRRLNEKDRVTLATRCLLHHRDKVIQLVDNSSGVCIVQLQEFAEFVAKSASNTLPTSRIYPVSHNATREALCARLSLNTRQYHSLMQEADRARDSLSHITQYLSNFPGAHSIIQKPLTWDAISEKAKSQAILAMVSNAPSAIRRKLRGNDIDGKNWGVKWFLWNSFQKRLSNTEQR